jgi:hypothetical protein
LLEKNGKMLSSKRTRHIEIRFFFVTDNVEKKHLRIEYCPTDDMVGDFFTKPLQGSKFTRFRASILGTTEADMNVVQPVCKECVEANDSPVTSMDDKSGSTTSWTEVVSKKKKKPDGLKKKVIFSSSLVGKQSDARLTLFTKRS